MAPSRSRPPLGPRVLDREDIAGVRLDFARPGSEDKQTLYYFRFNLRNNSLQSHEKFVSFLKGFGPVTTFAKAASYLMHKPGFSGIRQFILDQSLFVLDRRFGHSREILRPDRLELEVFRDLHQSYCAL